MLLILRNQQFLHVCVTFYFSCPLHGPNVRNPISCCLCICSILIFVDSGRHITPSWVLPSSSASLFRGRRSVSQCNDILTTDLFIVMTLQSFAQSSASCVTHFWNRTQYHTTCLLWTHMKIPVVIVEPTHHLHTSRRDPFSCRRCAGGYVLHQDATVRESAKSTPAVTVRMKYTDDDVWHLSMSDTSFVWTGENHVYTRYGARMSTKNQCWARAHSMSVKTQRLDEVHRIKKEATVTLSLPTTSDIRVAAHRGAALAVLRLADENKQGSEMNFRES